jgi:hypothetical protein
MSDAYAEKHLWEGFGTARVVALEAHLRHGGTHVGVRADLQTIKLKRGTCGGGGALNT